MSALASTEVLTEVAEGVIVRPMLTLDGAIDFACSGLAAKTRADYTRLLHRFANDFPRDYDVAKVTEDDVVRYLSRRRVAPTTLHWEYRVLCSFFSKLHPKKIKKNPMDYVPSPRRPDSDSLDLVRISSDEMRLMLSVTETWPERLCLAVLAYLGPRRGAAARIRVRDYWNGRLKFHEKGGKVIWKPVPAELALLIEEAREASAFWPEPNDYLIPPEGEPKKAERDDRIIWRIVRRVAARAGVNAHTHSLRAAFADFYLDSGGDGKALQLLMGHKSPMTTERYLQRFDRERRMEQVTTLSWQERDTCVYFIAAGDFSRDGTPVKIGYTAGDPRDRFSDLQQASHEELILVAVVEGSRSLEGELHKKFSSSRIRGEWFKTTPAIRAYVSQHENKQPFGLAQPSGSMFSDNRLMGAGGFEPPKADSHGGMLPDSLLEAIRLAIQAEMGRLH